MSRSKSPSTLVRQCLTIGAITSFLYIAVDTTFGILYPPKPYESHRERLHAPAYVDEPYFSEGFLVESFTQPGGWIPREGTRLVFPHEFHGRFFNIDFLEPTRLPYRRTLQARGGTQSQMTILLLGGSTIYNSEVPDAFTVASQLGRILSQSTGRRYDVINAGVTSANSIQELERLKLELNLGLRPDIVVSFSGINDALQGIYFGKPDGVMFEYSSKKKDPPNEDEIRGQLKALLPASVLEASRWVRATFSLRHIYDASLARRVMDGPRSIPPHLQDELRIADLASETKSRYVSNMQAAERLSESYHFRFIAVLQPHLYSADFLNKMEDTKLAAESDSRRLPKADLALRAAYSELQHAIVELDALGVEVADCAALFAAKTDPIFLDSQHVNSIGNMMIAEGLAAVIDDNGAGRAPAARFNFTECKKLKLNRPPAARDLRANRH